MRAIALVMLALFAGCTDQAIIEAAFPDREKYAFASRDGESIFTYTCAPKETPEATKAHAREAHVYLDTRFNAAVDGAAEKLTAVEDQRRARAITRALDAEIEDIVEQTEERYECLFIQGRDV
ncbi:hypothetical protein C8N43_2387 [Litoreibacter ponti]|uniref:Uncharacterized protein n=1 Tax=Litoreibacter ponti TaxID=1510457 RepID=A0A2T6BNU1_9RHOB|nr:hypothetical protein [Litoreibacter ponti]PTX57716.1 hypothetical protein C8N43_2387 [Litoreibacter ponti]